MERRLYFPGKAKSERSEKAPDSIQSPLTTQKARRKSPSGSFCITKIARLAGGCLLIFFPRRRSRRHGCRRSVRRLQIRRKNGHRHRSRPKSDRRRRNHLCPTKAGKKVWKNRTWAVWTWADGKREVWAKDDGCGAASPYPVPSDPWDLWAGAARDGADAPGGLADQCGSASTAPQSK